MDLRGFGLSDEDLRELGYRVGASSGERRRKGDGDAHAGGGRSRSRRERPSDPAARLWATSLIVLAATAWLSGVGRGLPGPTPAAAPDTSFSSARAMASLVEIARAPRPVGSPEHGRVRDYLVDRLGSLGLEAEVQVGTVTDRYGSVARAVTIRNVVVTLPGADRDLPPLLLTADYDGAPSTTGAAHNGIGVASLLEVVRALSSSAPATRDVLVAFTDGGELGGVGERAVRAMVERSGGAHAAVSIRATAGSGPVVPVGVGRAGSVGLEALARSGVRAPIFSSAADLLGTLPPPDGEVEVPGGIDGVTFVTLPVRTPHVSADLPGEVSERTLQHAGEQLLATTRRLAGMGGSSVRERVYGTLPLLGTLGYPRSWVWPTTLGLVLAWVALVLLVRARGGGIWGGVAGVVLGASVIAAGAAAGMGLLELVLGLHPEQGVLASPYRTGPHAAALGVLTVGIVALALGVARRRVRSDELVVGATLIPVVFLVTATALHPGVAPAVQWPLAVSLIGAAALTALGPARARRLPGWLAAMAVGVILVALTVPQLQLAIAGWSFGEAMRMGATFGLVGVAALPVAGWIAGPRSWLTAAGSVVIASLLFGSALPSVRGAHRHPTPTALAYLTEAPAATGPMVSRLVADSDSSRVRAMAGEWLTAPGPGERWARSWVAEEPTGSTRPGLLLIPAVDDDGRTFVDAVWERAGGAPDASIAEPRARALQTRVEAGRRISWIAIEPGLGGEMVGLQLAAGSPGSIAGVEDFGWPETDTRTLLHWGTPRNDALIVWLETPPDTEWAELTLVEHHLRPREVLGGSFFQRADSLVPNTFLGSDRVIQRTSLRIALSDSGTPTTTDGA